jgi:hypothetical protein
MVLYVVFIYRLTELVGREMGRELPKGRTATND